MASLISKASLLMVPSVYEDGTLYNVLPSGNKAPDETGNHNGYDQTRADFTFSRGFNLTATRVNANGLIEKGRANYILYSQEFDNAYWNKAGFSVTANQTTAPNGTLTADLIDDGTASGNHYIEETESIGGGVATASIHAKYVDTQYLWLAIYDTQYRIVVFDIQNGTIGNKSQSSLLPTIEDLGNGWYRCSVSHPDNTRTDPYISFGLRDDNVAAFGPFTGTNRQAYVWGAQLENGLVATDYIETGATTATAGILENTPRIDYSSGAGALLLEPLRSNIVVSSEYLSHSSWANVSCTITTNNTTSPEGLGNATLLSATGSTSNRVQDYFGPLSGVHTHSVYIKSTGTATRLNLQTNDSGGLTLDVPAIGTPTIQAQGSSNISGSVFIDAVGTDGWYRVGFSYTPTGGAVANYFQIYPDSQNGTGSIYLWGIQAEAGSYVSSYVPTYGSAATRGADSCSVTGASDVIGQTTGVIFSEMSALADDGTFRQITLSDGTSNNLIHFDYSSSANGLRVFTRKAGVSASFTYTMTDTTENAKFALRYAQSDFALFIDGVKVKTNTSCSVPTSMTDIEFDNGTGVNNLEGNVKQFGLFKGTLTDAECISLTS